MAGDLFIIGFVSLIVIIAGIKKSAIGEIVAFLLVIAVSLIRTGGLTQLGFYRHVNWPLIILTGFALGILMALASTVVFEPLAERLTGKSHDFSSYENLRGNFTLLLKWIPFVWLWVSVIEEVVFRGFILKGLITILGGGYLGIVTGLFLSSIIFGLPHMYQGKSGVLSTGIVGLGLGLIFVIAGFNLWLLIMTHGVTDTMGLAMIYSGMDRFLKKKLSIF